MILVLNIFRLARDDLNALAAFARMNGPVINAKLRVIYLCNRLTQWSVKYLFLQHKFCV
jgi:hypothetical protein